MATDVNVASTVTPLLTVVKLVTAFVTQADSPNTLVVFRPNVEVSNKQSALHCSIIELLVLRNLTGTQNAIKSSTNKQYNEYSETERRRRQGFTALTE